MANSVIQAETGHIKMGPTRFVIYAADFLNAYRSFETDKPFSPAKYYLVCRAVELSLKSFLLLKNVPIKEVKYDLRHDLHKILRKSKKLGINAVVGNTGEERAEIEKANGWYNRKGFEYFDIQNIVESKSTLPDLNVMNDLADRLINTLKPICLASAQQT